MSGVSGHSATVEVSTQTTERWLDPYLSEDEASVVSESAQRAALIQLEMIFVCVCVCVCVCMCMCASVSLFL